jgi:hypothetical protein
LTAGINHRGLIPARRVRNGLTVAAKAKYHEQRIVLATQDKGAWKTGLLKAHGK